MWKLDKSQFIKIIVSSIQKLFQKFEVPGIIYTATVVIPQSYILTDFGCSRLCSKICTLSRSMLTRSTTQNPKIHIYEIQTVIDFKEV